MLYGTICFALMMLDAVQCSLSASNLDDDFEHINDVLKGILSNSTSRRGREERVRAVPNAILRTKRGIVLIDEDFDVPAEPGMKHGWDDGDFEKFPQTDADNSTGSEETIGSTLADDAKSSAHMTPINMRKLRTTLPQTTEDAETEGSGDTATFQVITEQISTDPSTTSHDAVAISSSCLNRTCNHQDVSIFNTHRIPELGNITLTCDSKLNGTMQSVIRWYKLNESGYISIDASKKSNFEIQLATMDHSGTYVCTRIVEESCCHNLVRISVYQVPNYSFHLMIIGAVAASAFLICLLLVLSQKIRLKRHKKQLKKYMDSTEASFNLKIF